MNDLNKPRATTLEIGEEAAAQRIDNFLLKRLRGVPKSHVYRVLRSGEVRVNSGRVGPDYRLQLGDRVRVPPVRWSAAGKAQSPPSSRWSTKMRRCWSSTSPLASRCTAV